MIALVIYIFLVKRVPGQGPEQRESEKTLLYLQINILISYIIIKLLINENHPGPNREWNSYWLFFFYILAYWNVAISILNDLRDKRFDLPKLSLASLSCLSMIT